ncbi:MAG TPA: hypothetical protein VGI81_20095 [Tepidisphaeraceae bacterium]|jgi:hypothetical protein
MRKTTPQLVVLMAALALMLLWAAVARAQPSPAAPPAPPAQQPPPPQPTLAERVAAMKNALMLSQKTLRQYEWIETTALYVKGEAKSSTQQRCYYGADGTLQKVPVTPAAPAQKPKGIRGRIAENKKEEMTDAMKQAIALVKGYIPPDPAAIQRVHEAGNASLLVLVPGQRIRLDFRNYRIPGDLLGVEMTLADNRLSGITVSSFMDEKQKEPVTLIVQMSKLDDGTGYARQTDLEVKSKDLRLVVTNSGYRKQ